MRDLAGPPENCPLRAVEGGLRRLPSATAQWFAGQTLGKHCSKVSPGRWCSAPCYAGWLAPEGRAAGSGRLRPASKRALASGTSARDARAVPDCPTTVRRTSWGRRGGCGQRRRTARFGLPTRVRPVADAGAHALTRQMIELCPPRPGLLAVWASCGSSYARP